MKILSPEGTITAQAQLWAGVLVFVACLGLLIVGPDPNENKYMNNWGLIVNVGGVICGATMAWTGYRRTRK
jgi:hypothetical protein